MKVVRQGATAENPGTVMVELRSDEARASIMKTKKVLEHHHSPELRKVIIKNMKSKVELKMDIALNQILKKLPGGDNFYIANNGQIREKTPQQRAYQNSFSFQARTHHRPAQNISAGFSTPQYSMPPPPSYSVPPPARTRDYGILPPPPVIYQGSHLPPTMAQQTYPFNPSGSHQEFITRPPGPFGGLYKAAGQFPTPSEQITAPLIQLSTPNTNALPTPAENLGVAAMNETSPPNLLQLPDQHHPGHEEQLQQPVHHTQSDQPNVNQVPVSDA